MGMEPSTESGSPALSMMGLRMSGALGQINAIALYFWSPVWSRLISSMLRWELASTGLCSTMRP